MSEDNIIRLVCAIGATAIGIYGIWAISKLQIRLILNKNAKIAKQMLNQTFNRVILVNMRVAHNNTRNNKAKEATLISASSLALFLSIGLCDNETSSHFSSHNKIKKSSLRSGESYQRSLYQETHTNDNYKVLIWAKFALGMFLCNVERKLKHFIPCYTI